MHSVIYVLLRRLRSPLIVLISVYAVTILGMTLVPGQDDQGNLWYMDFFHAFYFVSFMGSTIGFGEIPYAFTDAQRAWTTVGIYATVIAWLYGIGALLATIQEPSFQRLLKEAAFKRKLRKIAEPFYLICGYGDTGKILVQALDDAGLRSVVIDREEEAISVLGLDDLRFTVPAISGDGGDPSILLMAGLGDNLDRCAGVITLTSDDDVNLRVALATDLLGNGTRLVSRVETLDAGNNISSFGNNVIINPYETFAGRLALALHSPGTFVLLEWLTGVPGDEMVDLVLPPKGRWILCGYGRFGKAVEKKLEEQGIESTLVEQNPETTGAPPGAIRGRGTERSTLELAGIEDATGIVAGTDNDGNNLSILRTAKEINPGLFTVGRQNSSQNTLLFQGAGLDLVMQSSSVIAHKIFALIRTPLIGSFVTLAAKKPNDWANELVSSVAGLAYLKVPQLWELHIGKRDLLDSLDHVKEGRVRLKDLCRNPRNRDAQLPCIALLLHRRGGQEFLTPSENTLLEKDDQILFCGRNIARRDMEWISHNRDVLQYVLTGEEHPSATLWKWFSRTGSAEERADSSSH